MSTRVRKLLQAVALIAGLHIGGRMLCTPLPAADDGWVRTVDGWEREESVWPHLPVYEPALHPAVVASFVWLASAWALIAFPARLVAVPLAAQQQELERTPKPTDSRANAARTFVG